MKLKHEVLGVGMLAAAGAMAFTSQIPEVIDCRNQEGGNATTWTRGEISFPDCEGQMSTFGEAIHHGAEGIMVLLTLSSVLVLVENRRSQRRITSENL